MAVGTLTQQQAAEREAFLKKMEADAKRLGLGSLASQSTGGTRNESDELPRFADAASELRAIGDWLRCRGLPEGPCEHLFNSKACILRMSGSEKRDVDPRPTLNDLLADRVFHRLAGTNPYVRLGTVVQTRGLGYFAALSTDSTTEGTILVADNDADSSADIVFAQTSIPAYRYTSKMIIASHELVQDSLRFTREVEPILASRLSRITARHFGVGTGTDQPLGLFGSAAASGVVAAGAVPTSDELLSLRDTVDVAYWQSPSAAFIMTQTMWTNVLKALDSSGWPLVSFAANGQATFAGHPVVLVPVAPTGLSAKAVCFGALDRFVVRMDGDARLVRFTERYATANQVGFVYTQRIGGALCDTAAVKSLALAAA